MKTALLHDPIFMDHDTGPGHPEQPARYRAVIDAIARAGLMERLLVLTPRPATDAEITVCHAPEYLETARRDILAGLSMLSTGDTEVCRDSLKVATLAAGGVLNAVDAVAERKAANAFCVVRPPGHHATRSAGMGFCVFNNIAIAARYAQKKHGIERVLIVDWDVHHGNGTQDIFYEDPTVFFFSTHQFPWYPGTGSAAETGMGNGRGYTLNCPLPAGAGRDEILGAFRDKLLPEMRRFKPEFVFISAGFDSRVDDPLGQFRLTDDDFRDLTLLMKELAHEHAGGRLVSLMEGGYNLDGLGNAAAAHVGALLG